MERTTGLKTLRGVTIALTLSFGLLFACRSTDPGEALEAQLHSTISDPVRRAEVARLIERRDEALDALWTQRADIVARARKANSNYETSNDDLAEILEEIVPAWEVYREVALDVAIEMRAVTTVEEWEALAPLDLNAILAIPSSHPADL